MTEIRWDAQLGRMCEAYNTRGEKCRLYGRGWVGSWFYCRQHALMAAAGRDDLVVPPAARQGVRHERRG